MLTAKRVDELFRACLGSSEPFLEAEGMRVTAQFDKAQVEKHAAEICSLLLKLPESFRLSQGVGDIFANACDTRHGNQWGEHVNIDQLLCLGLATGKLQYALPRDQWHLLSGMPVFFILDKSAEGLLRVH